MIEGEDGILLYFAAHIFLFGVKIDPPDDQNQEIFSWPKIDALNYNLLNVNQKPSKE